MEEKELTEYHLASFLLMKGHKLKRIEFKTTYAPQTGTFVFENDDNKIDEDINSFWNNEKANIQDFINNSRILKHRLQQAMSENGVYKYGIKKNLDRTRKDPQKPTEDYYTDTILKGL